MNKRALVLAMAMFGIAACDETHVVVDNKTGERIAVGKMIQCTPAKVMCEFQDGDSTRWFNMDYFTVEK